MGMFMSYCQFENTSHAMAECIQSLIDRKKLSASELSYAQDIRRMCEEFIEEYDEHKEEFEEETENE